MSRAIFAEKATLASEKAKEFLSGGGGVVSRARSLVLGDAQFFSVQPKLDDLRSHLESDSLHEKQNAMKRIIAQMCKGNDMSALFTDVVKNIHNSSIDLRRLIYFYITHYAEDRPNEALLSISAFQKDLLDCSMHVRSLALRMLSSIRIPAIQPLVMVAVKKCVSDLEPLVRRTAAISLAQMHAVSGGEEDIETVYELLQQLLADRSMEVVSAAALSFIEICPDKKEFIHPVYRDLCRSLLDCDEWGQVVLLHVLMRYARTQFCDPNNLSNLQSSKFANGENKKKDVFTAGVDKDDSGRNKKKWDDKDDSDDDYTDEDDDSFAESSSTFTCEKENFCSRKHEDEYVKAMEMDFDHRLLLDSVKPLFMSLNSAVVVAATSVFYHCAPKEEVEVCVRPLMRLLGGQSEHHSVVLGVIYTIVLSLPEPFIPYIKEFFLLPHDVRGVRELKIRIMSRLATMDNLMVLLREFSVYLRSFYVDWVVDAIRGLGLIVFRLPTCASHVMRLLSPLMSHKNGEVVSESISVFRLFAVQGANRKRTCQVVYHLLCQVMSDEIFDPAAKANIFWLVGENIQHHSLIATAAPECFRVFVKKFAQESTEVKKQVLMLGFKIWIVLDGNSVVAERFKKLFFYALELARFDDDYEVRDCSRLVQCAVDRQTSTFTALKDMLLSEKPFPQSNDLYVEHAQYQLGTLSHFFGNSFPGYCELPPWSETPTDPLLRGFKHGGNSHHHCKNKNDFSVDGTSSSDSTDSDSSSVDSSRSSDFFTESSSERESEFYDSTESSGSRQITSYETSCNSNNESNSDDGNDGNDGNDDNDDNNYKSTSQCSIALVCKEEGEKEKREEQKTVVTTTEKTQITTEATSNSEEKLTKKNDNLLVNTVVRHIDPHYTAESTTAMDTKEDDVSHNQNVPAS